ncbi:MAG: hypothetical protein ACOC4I_01175 [Spirochaetota bacterium]
MSKSRVSVFERIRQFLGRLVDSVNPTPDERYVDDGPPATVFRRRDQLSRYKRSGHVSETNAQLYARLKRGRFSHVLDTYHILEHGKPREAADERTDETSKS